MPHGSPEEYCIMTRFRVKMKFMSIIIITVINFAILLAQHFEMTFFLVSNLLRVWFLIYFAFHQGRRKSSEDEDVGCTHAEYSKAVTTDFP